MATQRELAKYLDTNEHVIRELNQRGVLKKPTGRGASYNLDECRVAYIRHLLAAAAGNTPATDDESRQRARERQQWVDDLDKERARKEAELADKLALENQVRRGELIPATVLTEFGEQVAGQVRGLLESLSGTVKRNIPHLRHAELHLIQKECARVSTSVAEIDLKPPTRQNITE